MSYKTFKAEILAGLKEPHQNQTLPATVIATAYTNLILRHIIPLNGGGGFKQVVVKTKLLEQELNIIFQQNITSAQNRINFWDQLSPAIIKFWTGELSFGPLGIVNITNPGTFTGPEIPESDDPEIWLDVFIGVASTHILTLQGIYTNYWLPFTIPWSGALLQTAP